VGELLDETQESESDSDEEPGEEPGEGRDLHVGFWPLGACCVLIP